MVVDTLSRTWRVALSILALIVVTLGLPLNAAAEIAPVTTEDVVPHPEGQAVETATVQQVTYEQATPRITVRDDLTSGVFPYPELNLPPISDSANQFNSVVFIEFFSNIFGDSGGFCSGTVINQRTVLTAAHCVQNLADDIGVPDGDLAPRIYFAPFAAPGYFAGNYLAGTSHIVHSAYNRNAFFLGSDIAMISLSQPVSRSARPGLINGISYAQLATADPALFQTVTLVGYGIQGIGSDPGIGFDARRRIATNQVDYVGPSDDVLGGGGTGQLIFTDFADPLDIAGTDYFCAFFWGAPSCTVTASEGTTNSGDSGGPLFVSNGSGGYTQVGVTSGGAQACGGPNGGYCDIAFWTSVAAFNSWIQANSPLKTVSSVAGDALWTSGAHWTGGVAPDNFKTPVGSITDFTNTANYYNVTLSAAGTTTLTDAREIDELAINGAAAGLTINASGNLFVWSQTTLTNGTMRVDGTLNTEYVDMFGGRVQGTGTIISAADYFGNFGGRVAPGNSIGTLSITGNYIQGVGGLLEIEVTNGSSDKLAVSGNASLAGTLQVKQFGAAPLDGQKFRILTTGGTVTGTFGTLDDQLPGLLYVKPIIYGVNFVDIEIDALLFSSLAGTGPVQVPVANALDALGGNAGMASAINTLQMLDPSQVPAALEALNPTRANAQAVSGFTLADILREQLGRRGHDLLGGSAGPGGVAQMSLAGTQLASADPTAEMLASAAAAAAAAEGSGEGGNAGGGVTLPNGYGLHFAGDFAWTKTDQPGAIGQDEADIQALTGGLDYNDGKGSVMGAALSYLSAEVDQKYGLGGTTDGDGLAISGFGATRMGGMTADVYASFGWMSYDTTRRLLVGPATFADAIGTTDSMQTQAGANFTADLTGDSSLRLSAIGGLHYIGLHIDGYSETGAGALSAVLPEREIESIKSMLGGQVALRISSSDRIVPFVRIQWSHEFSDDGLATSAAFAGAPAVSFTSPGPDLGQDWATLGAGFSGRLTPRTNVYLRYQGDFGRHGQDSHGLSAAARVAF